MLEFLNVIKCKQKYNYLKIYVSICKILVNMKSKKVKLKLVKSMYPCQDVPVVVMPKRCHNPCLYCDLYNKEFGPDTLIATGREEILEHIVRFKGAYFSAVMDTFLDGNAQITHNLLEQIWNIKSDFVPLIVTKQIIPKNTIELLCEHKDNVVVQISIPSLNNDLVSLLEPGAALVENRLKTIKALTSGGIKVLAVIMPWFNVYDKHESIKDLPRALSDSGVLRAIIGTGVLPERQRNLLLNTRNELIVNAVNRMTEKHIVTTKKGHTFPLEIRENMFLKIIHTLNEFGIIGRVCTADNLDLTQNNKLNVPLCTKFRHHSFKKDLIGK